MVLDKTNKQIIALLIGNARLSATRIGNEIGLSRTAVQDRIARLESSGIIKGYTLLLQMKLSRLLRP